MKPVGNRPRAYKTGTGERSEGRCQRTEVRTPLGFCYLTSDFYNCLNLYLHLLLYHFAGGGLGGGCGG